MQQVVSIGSTGELLVEFVCAAKNGHNRNVATYQGPFPERSAGHLHRSGGIRTEPFRRLTASCVAGSVPVADGGHATR